MAYELREGPDGETYAVTDRDNHMSGRDDGERLTLRGFLAVVAICALAVAIPLVVWAGTAKADTAHCPTEDSCVADYHDGGWHIEEVTP